MQKKLWSLLLILSIVFTIIPDVSIYAATQVSGVMPTVPVDGKDNVYRTIGLGYLDTWKNTAGKWDNGEPGTTHDFKFSYTINLSKKIKTVTVLPFKPITEYLSVWAQVRSDIYVDVYKTIPTQISVKAENLNGVGTKTATFNVNMTAKLDAPTPIKHPTDGLAAGVIGYRYYLPLVIEVEVEEDDVTLTTQHFNVDGTKLESETPITAKVGTTLITKSKSFTGLQLAYYRVSTNGGKSFGEQKTGDNVSVYMQSDTIVRYYYGSPAKVTTKLDLSANPSSIKEGTTSNVTFTLDAGNSYSTNGIKSYEFFFGDSESTMKSLGVKTESSTTTTVNSVSPDTDWYGKVIVTDTKGVKAESSADVHINEIASTPNTSKPAYVSARIKSLKFLKSDSSVAGKTDVDLQLVDYIDEIEQIYDGSTDHAVDRYIVWIKWSEELMNLIETEMDYTKLRYNLEVDASNSWSTNDIGKYQFTYTQAEHIKEESTSNTYVYQGANYDYDRSVLSVNGDDLYWSLQNENDKVEHRIKVKAYDSVQTDVSSESDDLVMEFRMRPEPEKEPKVQLTSDMTIYTIGESAILTPTYTEYNVPIIDKTWQIKSLTTDLVISGTGDIPSPYELNIPATRYTATQTIYYTLDGVDTSSEASVTFRVIPLRSPEVYLSSDKSSGIMPLDVKFTDSYVTGTKYYTISKYEWKITKPDGTVLESNSGRIQANYNFNDTLPTGKYIATQTIYWLEDTGEKSASASVTLNLISPVPLVSAEISMADGSSNPYFRIDTGANNGIEMREVLIDLTPSTAANQNIGNTIPLVYTSDNTQIQIVPLSSTGDAALDKNSMIQIPSKYRTSIADSRVHVIGSGIASIRLDSYGTYRIRYRVSNGKYTSNWSYKDIVISEDKPPKITMTFEGVETKDTGDMVTKRDSDLLDVYFNIRLDVESQDTDYLNNTSSKIIMKYDYNGDNDLTNDSSYSSIVTYGDSMKSLTGLSISPNILNDFIEGDSDYGKILEKNYQISMQQIDNALLGKVMFDYYIPDMPYYKIFNTAGMATAEPKSSNTYSLSDKLKQVLIENSKGIINVSLGSKGKVEITIVKGYDSFSFNYQSLINYFGEDITIYLIDANGNRTLVY